MATSLGVWTQLIILYQTIVCLIIGSLTLQCRLAPDPAELREVTLVKLLYLYEPRACGKVRFYNFTLKGRDDVTSTNILWPLKNPVAAGFRKKIQLWIWLHLIWLLLSVMNVTRGQRSSGLYVTLLPFTICGVAVLVVDAVCTADFLKDSQYTKTEVQILRYINGDQKDMLWLRQMIPLKYIPADMTPQDEDTSWIALLFAYGSCRGVVQWIVNFWLIKDNYFEGISLSRRLREQKKYANKIIRQI